MDSLDDKDTSSWEEWQRDYKYGAFYIFPPRPVLEKVNALRSKYDPKSQAICEAHISLTVPLPRQILCSEWNELEEIVASAKSFPVVYGPIHQYPGIPGVVLRIEPAQTIKSLVATLENAPQFHGATPRSHPFSPHMTIAEFVSMDRTLEILEELRSEDLSGSFLCEKIYFASPNSDFVFRIDRELKLKP